MTERFERVVAEEYIFANGVKQKKLHFLEYADRQGTNARVTRRQLTH